jgi:hypothetical protein
LSVRIVRVDSQRERARFIDLPWRLYRGDPLWVPPLRRDVRLLFDAQRNPFFAHGAVQPFLAERGGRAVGRVAAIVNEAHNAFHGDRIGFFGCFECEDDPEAARALLDAGAAWVAERGRVGLRGPVSFSTNDECGTLVDGFDTPPMVLMPHNPAHHARLLEGAGFAKAKDLIAYRFRTTGLPERLVRAADALRARSRIAIRSLDLRRFDEEVARVREVYNDAWEKNWGFVPMTRAEMDHMAAQLRPVVDADLLLFAEDEGRPIAFALALPDLNQALRHANGRLFPFGALAIWWHARRIREVRVLTLGIRHGYRRFGVDSLLYIELFRAAAAKGYTGGECSWILEDNVAMRRPIERMGGVAYKTYRIYERGAS